MILIGAIQLALLAEIAARNEKYKWLQIASQFYDRTGIRISAAAVKAKLDGGTL